MSIMHRGVAVPELEQMIKAKLHRENLQVLIKGQGESLEVPWYLVSYDNKTFDYVS
jgi:hypothetical protein